MVVMVAAAGSSCLWCLNGGEAGSGGGKDFGCCALRHLSRGRLAAAWFGWLVGVVDSRWFPALGGLAGLCGDELSEPFAVAVVVAVGGVCDEVDGEGDLFLP